MSVKKIIELEDEIKIKEELRAIEKRALEEELNLIMRVTPIETREDAYQLLMKYRQVWEFTANISTSGDSLTVTLPKKEAKERGITKGAPVLVALKTLRFFDPPVASKCMAPKKIL